MEGDDMPVTIEKARVNLFNAIGFALMLVSSAFAFGVTWNSMSNADAEAQRQIAFVVTELKDVKSQLPAITQLQFQMTTVASVASKNEKAIEATNDRIGRVVDSFGGKLDTVIDRLNTVASDVKVLTSKRKDKVQPTSFKVGN